MPPPTSSATLAAAPGSGAPWSIDGADATLTAIADPTAPHGTALRLTGHSGSIARIYESIEGAASTLAQGTPFAVRFLAKALNPTAQGQSLHARLWEIGGASGAAVTASVTSTFTNEWTTHEFVGQIQATGRTELAFIVGAPYGEAAVGAEYGLADLQAEQGWAPSSYADGSLGNGYAWSDSAHASNSTRAGTVGAVGLTRIRPRSIAVWLTPTWPSTTEESHTIVQGESWELAFDGGDWVLSEEGASVSLPPAHDSHESLLLVGGWTDGRLRFSVGSGAVVSAPRVPRGALSEWMTGGDNSPHGSADAVIGPIRWLGSWPSASQRAIMERVSA